MQKVIAKLTTSILALILVLSTLVGCESSVKESADTTSGQADASTATATSLSFTDDLGNEVKLDQTKRVVACLSSFAQTWQLAGGQGLVGLTDDAKTEGKVQLPADVQYVGNYDSLNLEAIIALEPDFVILSAASRYKQTDLQEALAGSGINYAYFMVTHFEDYERMLKTFTDITGRTDLYQTNGIDVRNKITAIEESVPEAPDGKKPTAAFFITESRGTRIQDSTTMPGSLLTRLGAVNLADKSQDGGPKLTEFSIESLLEANPDYIFVLPMGNTPEATAANLAILEQNPAWADIPAVKNGKYFKVDQEHFLYKPNNLWDESYQIIFDDLYK